MNCHIRNATCLTFGVGLLASLPTSTMGDVQLHTTQSGFVAATGALPSFRFGDAVRFESVYRAAED